MFKGEGEGASTSSQNGKTGEGLPVQSDGRGAASRGSSRCSMKVGTEHAWTIRSVTGGNINTHNEYS